MGRELIEWSEALLDDDERDVLTCLSTFAGAAIASDIAVVAERDSTELAIGSLAGCVDQSLVIVDTVRQPTSYRLLETVRSRVGQRRTPAHMPAMPITSSTWSSRWIVCCEPPTSRGTPSVGSPLIWAVDHAISVLS